MSTFAGDAPRDGHLGDEAELYALGLLDPDEAALVERHVASCDACLRRVGSAEEAAASLASLLPAAAPSAALSARIARTAAPVVATLPRRGVGTRGFAPWSGAVAAVVAAAVIATFSWLELGRERERAHASDIALATVVHAHFLHASLVPAADGGVAAKVLYARDGSWLYVLVDRPPPHVEVFVTYGGDVRDVGEATGDGEVATLFVRTPARPTAVALRRDDRTLAAGPLPKP